MNPSSLLSVTDLSKAFRTRTFRHKLGLVPFTQVHALRNVSLEVPGGSITALLGPNGAGKTTLINIICDLIRADSGSVKVAGLRVPEEARRARKRLGVTTTNERSFFWRLSGRENLRFFATLYELPRRTARRRIDELLGRFGLRAHADRLFRFYSTGMKKRLALARCLLHDPQILLLDEPTSGLDPAATDDLLDLVRTQIAGTGKGVIWATHRMDEVTRLCDQVIVLVDGRTCFTGSVLEFSGLAHRKTGFRLTICTAQAQSDRLSSFARTVSTEFSRRGDTAVLVVSARDENQLSPILRELLDLGAAISSVEPEALSLNEVFVALTRSPAQAHSGPTQSK